MKKVLLVTFALVLTLSLAACGANTLSDKEVLEKAQSSELEGYPKMIFATALEDAANAMSIDWGYGWVSKNKTIEPSLKDNERPIHCSLVFAHGKVDVVFLNFIFDTEKSILVIEGGETDAGATIWDVDESALFIADLFGTSSVDTQEASPPARESADTQEASDSAQFLRQESTEALSMISKKGIDGFFLVNLTKDDVIKLLGEPDSVKPYEMPGFDLQSWAYDDYGIEVRIILNHPDYGIDFVVSVLAYSDDIPMFFAKVGYATNSVVSTLVDDLGFEIVEDDGNSIYLLYSGSGSSNDINLALEYDNKSGTAIITSIIITRR